MQVEQPLFTVATITYNSGKWVRQAIESVLSSSFTDFEYIIVDDCSSDDTWEIVQRYQDSRIVALRNEFNLREYPNRNKVLQHAKGKYILYIDGDDILYKHTLRNLSEYIMAFPEAEMIWGVLPPLNDYAVLPYLFDSIQTVKLISDTYNHIGVIGFTETLFLVKVLRNNGGFSEDFIMGDIYIRKKLALTCKVLFVPLGFAYWRKSNSQASSRLNKNHLGLLEGTKIELIMIRDQQNPLSEIEKKEMESRIKSNFLRWTAKNILLKGKLIKFINMLIYLNLNVRDLVYILKKNRKINPIVSDISRPLYNSFNFRD
jgi:glycosyltransferase involved in cell wall biosynthesis